MAKRKMAGRKTVVTKAKKAAKPATAGKKAGKKAAKKVAKKAARKKAAAPRKPVGKAAAKKAGPKKAAARKAAKKAAPRKAGRKAMARAVPRKAPAKKAAGRIPARRAAPVVKKPARAVAPMTGKAAAKAAPPRKAAPRRSGPARAPRPAPIRGAIPSSLDMGGGSSAAKSGRVELLQHIKERTETSPAITAGDVDADWQLAYSSGDEAPGGDNPTPDQDVVDEIGEALGVNYEDGEELKGAAKIEARDKHRWELDPASSDDYKDRD
jgi:hypothetical protein